MSGARVTAVGALNYSQRVALSSCLATFLIVGVWFQYLKVFLGVYGHRLRSYIMSSAGPTGLEI